MLRASAGWGTTSVCVVVVGVCAGAGQMLLSRASGRNKKGTTIRCRTMRCPCGGKEHSGRRGKAAVVKRRETVRVLG